MDIKAYISSGIIENYVLGMTSEEEEKELLRMKEEHPEVAEAINAYEKNMEEYTTIHAVEAPKELKTKIMSALHKEKEAGSFQENPSESTIKSLQTWKRIAIAAAILFLISVGINFYYLSQYNEYKQNYKHLTVKQEQVLSNNKAMAARLEKIEGRLNILMNPDINPVIMKGTLNHPGLEATVYWDKNSGRTYLGKLNLPAPPTGKTYQLWAIIDGKPVDLGIYNPKKDGELKKMKLIPGGTVQAFAITLEQSGGSPTPTMEQMYVIGKKS